MKIEATMLIYDFSNEQLTKYLMDNNYKKFRANQIWNWLYRQKVSSFKQMINLPADLLVFLEKNLKFTALELDQKSESLDGTIKFLYKLNDTHLIETVIMRQKYGISICVTTQVGCNIGCSFCASGLLKKKRDLTSGEIVAQIMETQKHIEECISYVVVMGIGEPFDNYSNLITFLNTINHAKGLAIGARHITVSTSGIIPKIKEYAQMGLQVNLAISLHASNNVVRSRLMKINKRYPIEELIGAIKHYILITKRRVTIEYILIDNVNDSYESAIQLVNLLKGINVYVNLIPYNEVLEAPYKRSKVNVMEQFYDTLKKNRIQVTLRREKGHDVNAACGQLRSQYL